MPEVDPDTVIAGSRLKVDSIDARIMCRLIEVAGLIDEREIATDAIGRAKAVKNVHAIDVRRHEAKIREVTGQVEPNTTASELLRMVYEQFIMRRSVDRQLDIKSHFDRSQNGNGPS